MKKKQMYLEFGETEILNVQELILILINVNDKKYGGSCYFRATKINVQIFLV